MDSTEDMPEQDVNMENCWGHFIVVSHDLDGKAKGYLPGHRPYGNVWVTFNMRCAYAVYQNIKEGHLVIDPFPVRLTGTKSVNPNRSIQISGRCFPGQCEE